LAKRLTEKEKTEIISSFESGKTIEQLSSEFGFTKLTISRNIKKYFGETKFKELINSKRISFKNLVDKTQASNLTNENLKTNNLEQANPALKADLKYESLSDSSLETQFTEIIPLNCDIENSPQKDLSSVPIAEVDFPKMVYMIVDKNIELVTKFLRDYPEWNFLSKDELNRKTIEIYNDQKVAKRFCGKEQKVIKVPNTNVFKIVSPFLISKGISRIVSPDVLIALS